ncbi:MAG: HDOD domain-containing protein [Candidatus Hydrogenedentes bacterium]|nr:HDOD domain-containing protein [Candidatus Hydrogenedentota bacterium]
MTAPDISDAIAHIKRLPTLPAVLGKTLDAISDPESSAIDLTRHIAADQSLSARLLKMVNSAYYGFYRQIRNVVDAVVILGFVEVRNLVLTTTAFAHFPKGSSAYDRDQLWRHSLAVAIAAERCAKSLGLAKDGGYFSAGLLHDIGKVAFDMLYPEQFREAARLAHMGHQRLLDVESRVFEIDHAQVGGLLAEHWHLPEPIAEAITYHHSPERAALDPDLAHVTTLANYLSYEADLGESSNGRGPEPPASTIEHFRFTEKQLENLTEELRASSERIDALLGSFAAAE